MPLSCRAKRAPRAPFFAAWAGPIYLWQRLTFMVLALGALLFCCPTALAHDIPDEMRAHTFVKAEGNRLHVLVRMPLALLLNIDLPKKGPGYIDLAQVEPGLQRAIVAAGKGFELTEDGQTLTMARGIARISMPDDRSFDSFDAARALLTGPRLPVDSYVFWNQGYFDAWLEYPIKSAKSSFALDFKVAPGLKDRLKFDLRYVADDGTVRAYDLHAGAGMTALDPNWHQAAWTFVKSGFEHILDGADHLLFLLCLILPFRRLDWKLAGVITAFTVGHSVTLIAAAYQMVPIGTWFPPLIEFLIAASILYMVVENVLTPNLKRRWLFSGLFGLVHGFGFSFLLQSKLQFAGSHLLVSLLAFNVGIELGQLLVLVIAMPLIVLLYRWRPNREHAITAIICLLIGHTTWHWMGERYTALREADWQPGSDMLTQPPFLIALAVALLLAAGWTMRRRRLRKQAIERTGYATKPSATTV